jgi:hypothetical protein
VTFDLGWALAPKSVFHPDIERAPPTLPFPHRGGRVL